MAENPDERAIFLGVLKCSSAHELSEYLQEACGDDADLRQRVAALLAAHDESRGPLDSPPTDAVQSPTLDHHIAEKPGDQIGPFKLLQELGRGGMGVVYMAEQSTPVSRRVALKIIKPGMDSGQVIARFEAERQALAMMDHPNIAKVLDAGATESGRPYFVMELVKGVPITQFCDEQQLSARERLQLFIQVCHAVQHAHQKGIIHRDLKPSNVMVTEFDEQAIPKVIDFGVAKATSQKLTDKTMFTQFGQIMGTLEYMSPEQAKLNQLDIDTRSDVYSLGVLLYELLTGDTPFDRKRLYSAAFDEMLRIIREEAPPKPSTRLSSAHDRAAVAKHRAETPDRLDRLIKGDLDWIAMKALEKDRKRRYATASSFAEDIQRFLNDEAIEARPPSRSYLVRKFVGRNKGVFAAATAIFVTLLAGIIGTTTAAVLAFDARNAAVRQKAEADRLRIEAETQTQKAVREAERANAANSKVRDILFQDALAFAMSRDEEKTENLIANLELVGASTAQVNLLRGCYHMGGDHEQMMAHAEAAVQADPDYLAAKAFLTSAYAVSGRLDESAKMADQLINARPERSEDFVILGWGLTFNKPALAIPLFEQVFDRHESGTARSLYSCALAHLAMHTNDLKLAERAREQQLDATKLLGQIPVTSYHRMIVLDAWCYLAKKNGLPWKEVAEEGDRAASKVTLNIPIFLIDVASHYDFIQEDPIKAEEVYQRMPLEAGVFRGFEGAFVFKHHGVQAALELMKRESRFDSSLAQSKAALMALSGIDLPGARSIMQQLEDTDDLFRVYPDAAVTSLLLGDRDQAIRIIKKTEDGPTAWNFRPELLSREDMVDFLLGTTEAAQLIAVAKTPKQLAFAHYLVAMKCLAEKQWAQAMDHFSMSVDSCWQQLTWHTRWSHAFLEQMRRDPSWPVGRGQVEGMQGVRENETGAQP